MKTFFSLCCFLYEMCLYNVFYLPLSFLEQVYFCPTSYDFFKQLLVERENQEAKSSKLQRKDFEKKSSYFVPY